MVSDASRAGFAKAAAGLPQSKVVLVREHLKDTGLLSPSEQRMALKSCCKPDGRFVNACHHSSALIRKARRSRSSASVRDATSPGGISEVRNSVR